MVHSQPISLVALMILSRWLATAVSTTATPLMSRMNTRARVSAILASIALRMSCARRESMMPTTGSIRMSSQMAVTGVDIWISAWLWSAIFLLVRRAYVSTTTAVSRWIIFVTARRVALSSALPVQAVFSVKKASAKFIAVK